MQGVGGPVSPLVGCLSGSLKRLLDACLQVHKPALRVPIPSILRDFETRVKRFSWHGLSGEAEIHNPKLRVVHALGAQHKPQLVDLFDLQWPQAM